MFFKCDVWLFSEGNFHPYAKICWFNLIISRTFAHFNMTLIMVFDMCISDQSHRFCNVSRQPLSETRGKERRLFLDATWEIVKNMTVPVTILNITSMSAFRSDAHVGKWNDNSPIADCSHWCLPGVPDMWNEILLSFLLYQLQTLSNDYVSVTSFVLSLTWFWFAICICSVCVYWLDKDWFLVLQPHLSVKSKPGLMHEVQIDGEDRKLDVEPYGSSSRTL